MKAVVFLGSGRWEIRDVPDPRVARGDDVLVEVERAGICGTDLHIPEDPPGRAALAEPLSCIYAAVEKAPPRPGDSVVVLGAGPIGLMFVLLYRRMGAGTILAVEPRELRRGVARSAGADCVLASSGAEVVEEARKLIPGWADIVVDAVGLLLP